MRGTPRRPRRLLGRRSLPRRPTDWIESAVLCALVAASLVAALAALQVGLRAHADALRQVQLERARTPITVELAQDVTVAVEARDTAAMIAIVTTGLILIAIFAVAAAVWSVVQRLVLAANRLRWKREWAAVEPLWSGRQHRS